MKFALWLKGDLNVLDPKQLAQAIASQLPVELTVGPYTARMTYQFGVSFTELRDNHNAQQLIEQCELALELSDPNQAVGFYDQQQAQQLEQDYQLLNAFRDAIRQKHLELWLQPKVDPQGKIQSFEALSRWFVDGKAIAESIYTELKPKFEALGRKPRLGILVVGGHAVIESFVGIKTRSAEALGIEMVRVNVSDKSDMGKIEQAAQRLVDTTDAVVIQLPLPPGIDVNQILAAVPREKDVDALNPNVPEEERLVHAPVALAVVEILRRNNVEIAGARTVVVGQGRLVGKPAMWLLKSLGANVSVFSLDEGSIDDLKDADIVILGAGNPGFIKPEHIKEGVALIDAGTSELNKKIQGDADPACAEVASVFTPVPGGVGPVAVAMIFRNLLELIQ